MARNLTVPELTKCSKELIKSRKDVIPLKPKVPTCKRRQAPILGQITHQCRKLDEKAIADEDEFDRDARLEW